MPTKKQSEGKKEIAIQLKKEYPKTKLSIEFIEFIRLRQQVEERISDKNGLWCFCRRGQRGTREYEVNCKKFQNKVDEETIKNMKNFF
jgi:hypothetical protein